MKIEPLPQVSASKVIGLLEFLDDQEGKEDIYKLAELVRYEVGELLSVIKMGEMLGFAETPNGDVVLLELGKQFLKCKMGERKLLIRERLTKLNLFQSLINFLKASDHGEVGREAVLDELSRYLPHEDVESLFNTVVSWGRFAELFGYNPDTEILYLDEEAFPDAK